MIGSINFGFGVENMIFLPIKNVILVVTVAGQIRYFNANLILPLQIVNVTASSVSFSLPITLAVSRL
jgi:hypothetical protein